jgi:hypothetical protein
LWEFSKKAQSQEHRNKNEKEAGKVKSRTLRIENIGSQVKKGEERWKT